MRPILEHKAEGRQFDKQVRKDVGEAAKAGVDAAFDTEVGERPQGHVATNRISLDRDEPCSLGGLEEV